MNMKIHPSSGQAELHANESRDKELLWDGTITGYIRKIFEAMGGEGFLGTLANKGRPNELRERLKAMWTTLGVVSALFAGVGLPTVISPQQKWQSDADASPVAKAMVYSIVVSFGLSFTVVMSCTMLLFSIDMMPTEQSITAFIRRFQHLSDASIVIFIGSIVAMVVGCIASIYSNYGWRPFVILTTFFSLLLAFLGFAFLFIHTCNAFTILEYRRYGRSADTVPEQQSPAVHPELPLPSTSPPTQSQSQSQQQPPPSAIRGAVSMRGPQPSDSDEEGQRDGPYPAPVQVMQEGAGVLAARSGMRLIR
ncbi:hypothetical protein Vretimale_5023 [Volvox reticuliferus]|uniref:Uncharacterized protein n=1 Tax=Volvox reticuliferus TaxID=1737510 RepID=A0A8J4DCA7_9CHLO|nr:hypothetical protein Vretifemale_3997 [Volvox reticuliferus]GIM00089.1 hypothetical protein Vretimale_5023 [Volvox reticuliferus]